MDVERAEVRLLRTLDWNRGGALGIKWNGLVSISYVYKVSKIRLWYLNCLLYLLWVIGGSRPRKNWKTFWRKIHVKNTNHGRS